MVVVGKVVVFVGGVLGRERVCLCLCVLVQRRGCNARALR